MAPGGQKVTRVEIDERAGGHYRTWKTGSGTNVGRFDSEILELVPDRRIVFRWGFIGPERRSGPSYDTRLTISLGGEPTGLTKLSLVHEDLHELAGAMPEVGENVGPGWEDVFDKLTALVSAHDGAK